MSVLLITLGASEGKELYSSLYPCAKPLPGVQSIFVELVGRQVAEWAKYSGGSSMWGCTLMMFFP